MTIDPTSQAQVQGPPAVLAGDALYDFLMAQIDPELTIAQLATLAEKYKDETPDQAAARAKRYSQAFEKYEEAFARYGAQWQEQFSRYERIALESLEHLDRANDEKAMEEVYAKIASFPAA